MSTEHQKYSTDNQADAIARFAAARGLEIVRTYTDEGKSGLRLDGRDALRALIEDVSAGRADYTTILVYDVSRWGRFQNADESAYLEYICTRAGIAVQYCAEQFENDGSLTATVIKSMKRAMAGEYSRELSTKVFAGQCRLISLGFRQGGVAGFGLRRLLVDEHRQPKAELRRGEHKSLQTDRVILVLGPSEEVYSVRRMYRLFVERGRSEQQIADTLNSENLLTDLGRPWTRGTVHQVLTNEKYVGNNLYNRVSFKLKKQRVRNPPDLLVRSTGAFEAVVDHGTFQAAARIIAERSRRYSNQEMLDGLSSLLEKQGILSALIIDEREDLPSSSAYRSRFGSLLRAYTLVGYEPPRDYRYVATNRFLRSLHRTQLDRVIAGIEGTGAEVRRDAQSDLLLINGEVKASIVVSRCLQTDAGTLRWKVRFDTGLRPDITVVIRMASNNTDILDFFILPRLDFSGDHVRMGEENGWWLDAYRFDTLDEFFHLTARSRIRIAV